MHCKKKQIKKKDRMRIYVKLAYVVDFDGTITRSDVTSALAKRYAGGAAPEISDRYRRGIIGMKEWLLEMVGHFSAGREQMLSTAFEAAEIKPGFASFVRSAYEIGSPVYIASDGFGFYIKPILERYSHLSYIERIYGNRLIFEEGAAVTIEMPHANPACDRCGNCKAAHVVRLRDSGHRVVYIGNGFNDRYGASHADMIFARAGDRLAQYCRAHEMAFEPFNDFNDISGFSYPQPLSSPNEPLCHP